MRIFSLSPRAPLYVGDRIATDKEATREWIPSDTLFAAMTVAWQWQGTMETRLAQCLAQPATLRLTSAFPRAGDVRLFPMPRGVRLNLGKLELAGKERKRIRWVSEGVFKHIVTFGDLSQSYAAENFAQHGTVWLLKDEIENLHKTIALTQGKLLFWHNDSNPRVTIDRVTNASNFFETAQVRFAGNCGLWFAAQGQADWAEQALTRLQDSGLGGMRSVGHGAFTFVSSDAVDWKTPTSGHAVLLSRYSPADKAEMQTALYTPASAFALTTVGGWCNDDAGKAWRRKDVRLVEEGALVSAGAVGRLVDVHPNGVMSRPVYRSGIAFTYAVQAQAVNT